MTDLGQILDAFAQALELERELGTRTVECDRALLTPLSAASAPVPSPAAVPPPSAPTPPASTSAAPPPPPIAAPAAVRPSRPPAKPAAPVADVAFLLEHEPQGAVAELLVRMGEALGCGEGGYRINDVSAKVLVVLGAEALKKWIPDAKAVPGTWLERGGVPALVTVSPVKTYRFFAADVGKVRALKVRLRDDLEHAMGRIGKKPAWKKS